MKKLLIISAICALLVPVSAFAANLGAFTNMSGAVKTGASFTIISSDGTKLTAESNKLHDGIDHAILGAVDVNSNQEFRDEIIFDEGRLEVRGTLLASKGKASGPADFLFLSSTNFIKGAAAVKIVGPSKKGKATVMMTFLARKVGFGNSTTAASTLDGSIKLPAMQKKVTLTNFSSSLF